MKNLIKKVTVKHTVYGFVATILLAIIVIFGIAFLTLNENQIKSQTVQIALLKQTIKNNNVKIKVLVMENASESVRMATLLNQPSPTPEIVYKTNTATKTQYIQEPAQNTYSHCTQAIIGDPNSGMNCYSY